MLRFITLHKEGVSMEPITGYNLKIINTCVEFARRFLLLPDSIEFLFDDCPSPRFPTMNNAAEGNIQSICFNKPWFLQRIDEHKDDLEFYIFHELRHVHQQYSIFLLEHALPYNDDIATIEQWRRGFNNYIRNVDAYSEKVNVAQEVEIDANAYAICLINLLHIDDDNDLMLSLPDEASALCSERSGQYYETKPELKRFLDNWKVTHMPVQSTLKKNVPIRKKQKVGANDPCPCGSGYKFKRCCRGKGIYD